MVLSFQSLWTNYPKLLRPCDGPWQNQCAIRFSIALEKTGFGLAGYKHPVCKHGHARGADGLANYLWRNVRPPRLVTNKQSSITNKKGIVFFENLKGFRGGRGDHIDLWNKGITKTGDYFGACQKVWFWELL
ncbi:type VI secretion system amidase effector protein Tae4 [Candidatus Thiosymbion oneisti]|uniref:type VI secretion system amidase effector protein Tae4 n=1 Tax=Candidatus Thiosymbion oneisti TaxID=589554 RepID=UPI001A9CA023